MNALQIASASSLVLKPHSNICSLLCDMYMFTFITRQLDQEIKQYAFSLVNILIRLDLHFNFGITQLVEELWSQEAQYTENKIMIMSESHIWIVTSTQRQGEKEDSYTTLRYFKK
jgi:hypothetical protein